VELTGRLTLCQNIANVSRSGKEMPMSRVSLGLSAPREAALPQPRRLRIAPASLRIGLVATAVASAALAWFVTRHQAMANPDVELMHVLQFMTLAKVLIGAVALWLVSVRFGYPIAPRLGFGYIAGAAIMASGPGAMWTTAHIILGSLLFYAGLGALVLIGWTDGGAGWHLWTGRGGLRRPIAASSAADCDSV